VISPYDLAFDHAGNLLIADVGAAAIRIVHTDGTIGTLAGNGRPGFSGDGGPATSATLNSPSALSIGPDGSIFIADGGNHRIRRITPDGMISTYAGNGQAGYSGDGGPAISASFQALTYSLAVDSAGNLFIADRDGNAVREVTPDGNIATIAGKAP
jgi:hypothetical protein